MAEDEWNQGPPEPGEPIDLTDPCARAEYLRRAYYENISGNRAYQISYTANGVARSVTYSVVDKNSLLAEIRNAEAECGKATGRKRRFAITVGHRKPIGAP
jgi:hypothetical protein